MIHVCRTCGVIWLWSALVVLLGGLEGLGAQPGGAALDRRFELADAVQLDRVDNAVLVQWERVQTLLADRQWDEAVDILTRLAEASDGQLMGVTDRRYVDLRAWRQMQLAGLPPEALRRYRARIDPVAQPWYEQGIARRDVVLLRRVVEQAFASRYGDDALKALGEIAFESGDYAGARACWERIVPAAPPTEVSRTSAHYPDTDLDLATVRAWLVLASIMEGAADRARAELAALERLHPDARGRLGHREGRYVDLLDDVLAASASWPPLPEEPNWPTFAGNPRRNRIAGPLVDLGAVAWRLRLRPAEDAGQPLSFHPLWLDRTVLVNDSQRILAVRLDSGRPTWGRAEIYREQLSGVIRPSLRSETLGAPQYTMTVFDNKLYARMGSPVTSQPEDSPVADRPGCLVCLDLQAEGRLLWKTEPPEDYAFEGSPVADASGVYVAMRRRCDIHPQAWVACLDAASGRLRWRRFICSAETPARGAWAECTNNLLTLDAGTLYFNTNLGAVAAVDAADGRTRWISLYPRDRRGDRENLAPHWRRAVNPCILAGDTLLVAPADSPRIFAFDAAEGRMLWQTGAEVEEAVDLLGATDRWLIASGGRLYWIGLRGEDRGRVKHVWPEGGDRPGCGRGLLAGRQVLFPTRDMLYIFDQQTARSDAAIDLAVRGARGGNLLVADGQLLIATGEELVAIGVFGGKAGEMNAK